MSAQPDELQLVREYLSSGEEGKASCRLVYQLSLRREWIEWNQGCKPRPDGSRDCPDAPKPPFSLEHQPDWCLFCPLRFLEYNSQGLAAMILRDAQFWLNALNLQMQVSLDEVPYDSWLAMLIIKEEDRKWEEQEQEWQKIQQEIRKARQFQAGKIGGGFTKVD